MVILIERGKQGCGATMRVLVESPPLPRTVNARDEKSADKSVLLLIKYNHQNELVLAKSNEPEPL